MGAKSTVDLTRQQAEDRFVELYLLRKRTEAKAREKARRLTNTELEDKLEQYNDEALEQGGGYGLENYLIR